MTKNAYAQSGVDVEAGYEVVARIKKHVARTERAGVMGALGGFGGMFDLTKTGVKEPVLISGTDGVGTKLMLAIEYDKHDTIGQDCVAMCVNDIIAAGAEPLYFLDYLAVGKLDPEKVATVVKGVAGACKESGCALIGGETAEMAGFYADGEYDIAGFAVGVVDKANIITGEKIKAGDVLLGIPSSGVHSNGYSLVRKICFDVKGFKGEEKFPELNGKTLGEELLTPTRLYPSVCLPLIEKYDIHGMVHVTGGGFYENISRILPEGTGVEVDASTWEMPAIFKLLQAWGNVDWHEMYRVFNMGIGMILLVSEEEAAKIQEDLKAKGEKSYIIGKVVEGNQTVEVKGGVFNE